VCGRERERERGERGEREGEREGERGERGERESERGRKKNNYFYLLIAFVYVSN